MKNISNITLELLNQYISGQYKKIENVDLKMLKRFTDFHNITPIICLGLEQDKSLKKEDVKPFIDVKMETVIVFAKQQYLREQIAKAFSKEQIDHIILKGSTVGKYYPEEWQRTGCDIDVLVKQKDFKKAREILKNELKLKQKGSTGHDVSFKSENNVQLELHFDSDENIISGTDLWGKAKRDKDSLFSLSNEMLLAYVIAHTAKHFKMAGCGIRAVLDLFFLKKNMPFNSEKLEAILSKYNLLTFYNSFSDLTDVWFNKKPSTAIIDNMTEYILSSGTYGTMANYFNQSRLKYNGNFEYIKSHIFLDFKTMSNLFPTLKKAPFLLPFYVVKRWYRVIFKKGGYISFRLKNNEKILSSYSSDTKQLFKDLEIEKL